MLEPRSTDQILRVLALLRQNKRLGFHTKSAASRAIQQVADESNVRYQTIGDGCRRRLGLPDMAAFHRLVDEWLDGDGSALAKVLRQNSSNVGWHQIDTFFAEATAASSGRTSSNGKVQRRKPTPAEGTVQVTLLDSESRMLRVLAQLENRDPEALGAEVLIAGVRQRLRAALG
jgi:hypothetical protein